MQVSLLALLKTFWVLHLSCPPTQKGGCKQQLISRKTHLRLWGFCTLCCKFANTSINWLSIIPLNPGFCVISLHQGKMRQWSAKLRQQVGDRSWHKCSTSSPLCAHPIHGQLTPSHASTLPYFKPSSTWGLLNFQAISNNFFINTPLFLLFFSPW